MSKTTLTIVFMMAILLCIGTQAFADPPNKEAFEAQKYQHEPERERLQKESEFYKENRKHYEEIEREGRKAREELEREDRKHREEMERRSLKKKERHRYFSDDDRAYIQEHYVNRYRKGCPPGLKKKRNGCMPPGQAKKWELGRPLPRDVIFYDLPPRILEHLGPPPSRHHRFVRVAQDILLITIGTGIVVDAIEDLNWEFRR